MLHTLVFAQMFSYCACAAYLLFLLKYGCIRFQPSHYYPSLLYEVLGDLTQIDQGRGSAFLLDLLSEGYELTRKLHKLHDIPAEADSDKSLHVVERIKCEE